MTRMLASRRLSYLKSSYREVGEKSFMFEVKLSVRGTLFSIEISVVDE